MRWHKLGRVYCADNDSSWARSRAYLPTSWLRDERTVRVYVAFLDDDQIGRIGYVDVAAEDPTRVLAVSPEPVLDVGRNGTFDEHGVSPTCVVADAGRLWLYYVGWQRGVDFPYTLLAGLAVSEDGGEHFQRVSQVPVLERSDQELYFRTAPNVMRENGRWRMWYVGGDSWLDSGGKAIPGYEIRHLESPDGRRWGAVGQVCLRPRGGDEHGLGRPWVVRDGERYRMWFSARSQRDGYRLAYAESQDGLHWERDDAKAGIERSAQGWDSQMQGLACVQPTAFGTYLFYNGNGYGATGFGVARAEA